MFGSPKKLVTALLALALLGACGDGEDRPGQVTSEDATGSGSGSGSASGSVSSSGAVGDASSGDDDDYTPATSVDEQLAIGDDVAAIKKAMGEDSVDWGAVDHVWSTRLAGLVDAPDVVAMVDTAIADTGGSDEVRAQRVEKGITVLLARKVVDELDGAADVHEVDEAWAYFTAKGNGPASTATKRAADFDLDDAKVRGVIVAALVEAQDAVTDGDTATAAKATAKVREGLDYVFYLATFKYLAAEDDKGRAEGAAFYLGIAPTVKAADAAADAAIVDAFAKADAAAGRAALHRPTVLAALGITEDEQVD